MDVTNTIGRRKTSVARLYMQPGNGDIVVNGKSVKDYFNSDVLEIIVRQPLVKVDLATSFDLKVKVVGGGPNGQAGAIRLAISRALCEVDPEHRPALKSEGFMTRDPRMVERKKPGRRKARRSFQFSKR
ncbi:MAG: small subunit ribosomal protein S9 [Roseivirga sp.]|jgi:small subunit ribosomal protein S9